MTHSEYIDYIQNVHGPIALEDTADLKRYVQNHVFDAAFGSVGDRAQAMVVSRDSVTELYFDTPEAMERNFKSEHVRTRVGPDGANFSDMPVALSLVAVEVEQPVPRPGSDVDAKALHFLRAAEGLELDAFFERWARAHRLALERAPDAAAALRRVVHSRQIPHYNRILSYFGGLDVYYEGVASLYFEDASTIGAFRAYEQALIDLNADPDMTFYRPDQSFFLYAKEVVIYEG
ncbi:EthD domain-containing protein [Brevundimonas sp. SL130]|uniref:EthD domain-containing protein n=1 Tax=Brevundimonas sp. SL130 TaxID=2995143 RepID=UPI00226CA549|nr:EthD domain-containing protein [Brevundimonas sp. SL130]WAC59027.1 EthD domain-containing protein [Brevundimonas sp. SL130]